MLFRQSIKVEPTYADALVGLALSLEGRKKMDEAKETMIQAVDLNPDQAGAYLKLGEWYRMDSNELSIDYYTNAIRIDSQSRIAYTERAYAHQHFNNYTEALNDYEKALSLDSNDFTTIFRKAYFHMSYAEFDASAKLFSRARSLSPGDVDVLFGLGLSYAELKQSDSARAVFEKGLEIYPDDPDMALELEKLP